MINKLLYLFLFLCPLIAANAQTSLKINEIMASNLFTIYDDYGDYDDWLEIYNSDTVDINISGYYITDDFNDLTKWQLSGPDSLLTIPAGDYLLLWADGESWQGPAHLGFRLSSSGEQAALLDPNGATIIDTLSFSKQYADISLGRYPDGSNDYRFFDQPTPGQKNQTGFLGVIEAPDYTLQSGIFSTAQTVSLSNADAEADLRYTLDGSIPDTSSLLYSSSIAVDASTVIRASAFRPDFIPGRSGNRVYFIDKSFSLPVLTIVTDPDNLFDNDTGIYANYNMEGRDWERHAHQTYFKDNQFTFAIPGGMRIQGNTSRFMAKKSFRLFYRKGYDADRLQYDIFNNPQVNTFKNLVLRAGYDDDVTEPQGTLLRDPLASEMWDKVNQLVSLGNFAILYLNNDYWGIYNIRESVNEYFIQDHTGYQNFDLIRYKNKGPELKYGTMDDWNELEAFFENNDFTQDSVYEEAGQKMDIDQFTSLQAFIQCTDYDSWGRGVSAYKEKSAQGRWRWTIWDMDRCFDNHNWNGFSFIKNSTSGLYWGNFMVHQLLKNERWKMLFVNRIADYLNYNFQSDKMINIIDSLVTIIEPEINNEIERWNGLLSRWENNVQALRIYAQNRPSVIRNQMLSFFNLSAEHTLSVSVNAGSGTIEINSLNISSFPWEGIYYQDVPVTISAKPAMGYRFKSWQSDSLQQDQQTFSINLKSDYSIQAIFEPDSSMDIVINEINYNSSESFDPEDWVEFFNPASFSVDLSGWIFQDENNSGYFYTFPENTTVEAQAWLVLTKDSLKFKSVFPDVQNRIGNFGGGDNGFGLSGSGERIQLFDNDGHLIDEVTYDDKSPWPEAADGSGYTLELMNPAKDNSPASNWSASADIGGTPGKINSTYTAISKESKTKPVSFKLFQNYPNPFNPSTAISYQLSVFSKVELIIYNILGEKVRTLVNTSQEAGKYKVIFNRNKLPSGIYFYRLKTQNFQHLRKMILVR